jgi:putative ABC transport system permease protein
MTQRNLQIGVRALRLLWRYRLRSALLMLSAALGVGGVVCSVNYGAGGSRQVLDQIRRMGTNVLIITPTESRAIAGRARTGGAVTTLVERDYSAIRKELLTRTRSSAVVTGSFRVKAGDLSKATTVLGCEPDYFTIKDWPMLNGVAFDATQERAAARVAVVGHTVAVDLFGTLSPLGQRLMINRVPFLVIGVLTERGQGLDVSNEDDEVYVPLTTAMRRLTNVDHYSAIVVEVNAMPSMDAASVQMRSMLRSQHRIQTGQTEDFQIQNQKTLLDTQMAAAARLNFFLRWIATSALTVSSLGIVAITWIAVKERTHEIGTLRALGATSGDIFFQITVETVALALSGSILGLAVSWPASRLISGSVGLPFVFERGTAASSFAAAMTIDLIFTFFPSRKAASVSPIEALRYE